MAEVWLVNRATGQMGNRLMFFAAIYAWCLHEGLLHGPDAWLLEEETLHICIWVPEVAFERGPPGLLSHL
jgi:hypothetical protein